MLTRNTIVALLAAVSLLWTVGCSQQNVNRADSDVQQGINVANQKASQLADKAKPALTQLDLGARVTTALRANSNLPDTIRVDASTTGVRLRGTVKTAQQKSLAGKVAKATLDPGKSVQNQLTVQ